MVGIFKRSLGHTIALMFCWLFAFLGLYYIFINSLIAFLFLFFSFSCYVLSLTKEMREEKKHKWGKRKEEMKKATEEKEKVERIFNERLIIMKFEESYTDIKKPLAIISDEDFGEGGYYITDSKGEWFNCMFKEETIKESIKKYGYDVKKAFENLIKELKEVEKETRIQAEIEKIKLREQKISEKEEAEKRLYGKVKTKRAILKPEEKEAIFRKFENKCSVCGKTEGLHIHHKDDNPKNNRIDNLTVLCGVCHKKIHMKVR